MNEQPSPGAIGRAITALLLLTISFCGFFWFGYWTAERAQQASAITREASVPELTPTSPEIPRLRTL